MRRGGPFSGWQARARAGSALALLGGVVGVTALPLLARGASDAGPPPALKVGSIELDAEQVRQRLERVPAFQLRTFGKTPAAIRAAFVDRVLVPELLFAEEAERRPGLFTAVAVRRRDVLKTALEDHLRAQALAEKPVTDAEIQRYYDQHLSNFVVPPRIRIWRILLEDRAAAEALRKELAAAGTLSAWSAAARAKSVDKATAMRQGELGFVRADGDTDVPRLRVDPALYQAAAPLKDGEIAPEVVAEGQRWAVIWRRGSLPERKRTLEQERAAIRRLLERERAVAARDALLERLRKQHVRDVDTSLLDRVPQPEAR